MSHSSKIARDLVVKFHETFTKGEYTLAFMEHTLEKALVEAENRGKMSAFGNMHLLLEEHVDASAVKARAEQEARKIPGIGKYYESHIVPRSPFFRDHLPEVTND